MAKKLTLVNLWEEYRAGLDVQGAYGTTKIRSASWRRLSAFFDVRRLATGIRMEDAAAYKRHEQARGCDVTWRIDLSLLKAMLRHVPASPLAGLKIPKPAPRGRAMSVDELRRLVTSESPDAPAARIAAAFNRVLLLTGARPGEARVMKWADVTEAHVDIDVFKRRRPVVKRTGMTEPLRCALAEIREASGTLVPRPEHVFGYWPSDNAARVALQRAWQATRQRAGLGSLRLHDARSTVGTVMAQARGVRAAQGALAHANYATTERYYIHNDPNVVVDMAPMSDLVSMVDGDLVPRD